MFWPFRKLKLEDVAKPIPLHEWRRKAQIVVIDDDPKAFPVKLLQKESYNIDYWKKVESLERLERGDYDIIILDIGGVATDWATEDGLAILEHIKTRNPSQIVVAFSGQTFGLGKNRFWQMADDTLQKPSDPVKCKDVIDHLIQHKFTPQHYWKGLQSLLVESGVPANRIRDLEHQLAKAIKRGKREGVLAKIESMVPAAETATRLLVIGTKLAGICGL